MLLFLCYQNLRFNFDFLLDEKSHKNILIHDVLNITLVGAKLLHIVR